MAPGKSCGLAGHNALPRRSFSEQSTENQKIMPASPEQSLLFACKAMNPFVNQRLLEKVNGVVRPRNSAGGVQISIVLHELAENDEEYQMQAFDFVLRYLRKLCKDAGFDLLLAPDDLLNAQKIDTIQDLADNIEACTSP